jgi:hypothetical protein
MDLSTLPIEEVTGRVKVVDDHEEPLPANLISVEGKLLFIEERWLTRQNEKMQEGSSSSKDCRRQLCKKGGDSDTGGGGGKGGGGGGGERKVTCDDTCLNLGHYGHWANDCC